MSMFSIDPHSQGPKFNSIINAILAVIIIVSIGVIGAAILIGLIGL